LIITNRARP